MNSYHNLPTLLQYLQTKNLSNIKAILHFTATSTKLCARHLALKPYYPLPPFDAPSSNTTPYINFAAIQAAASSAALYIPHETPAQRHRILLLTGRSIILGKPPRITKNKLASFIAQAELFNAYAKGAIQQSIERGDKYIRVQSCGKSPICVSRNARIFSAHQILLPFYPGCACYPISVPNETHPTILRATHWQSNYEAGLLTFAKTRQLSIPEAQLRLALALQTPTYYESILRPGSPTLQEVVPLY